MKYLVALFAVVMTGCSAFLVPHTNDPAEKLSYSKQLIGAKRAIPAQRLAKEALQTYEQDNNVSGASEAHFVLGILYKSDQGIARVSGSDSIDKSIHHLGKSKEGYLSINEKIQASKATFELAQAYRGKQDSKKYCSLYDESLSLYESGEGNEKHFSFNPKFKSPAHVIQAHIDGLCKN